MLDRRRTSRERVYLGGLVAFNSRGSTMACLVRDFSAEGARVVLSNGSPLPEELSFVIPHKGFHCDARIVWRRGDQAGLAFGQPQHATAAAPLDLELRLRASERARKDLRRRLEQLRSSY